MDLEARAAFAPESFVSSLAGDIAAFVIKMHRPASAPANKNAFHGWLNLIVLSARTEGINVFHERNSWPVAVNTTWDCSESNNVNKDEMYYQPLTLAQITR